MPPKAECLSLFFNDALPRNGYLKDGDLLPFDVILCQPDEELEAFLRLYAHSVHCDPSLQS
jgi:hypothetical protein